MRQAVSDAFKAPDRSKKAYFGVYPWKWKSNWKQSFNALRGNGRLLVAPILQTLIFNREPQAVINWANTAAGWEFQQIIPCHFDSPIKAGPHQFRQAFTFLEKRRSGGGDLFRSGSQPLPEEDFSVLRGLYDSLNKIGITPLPKEKR